MPTKCAILHSANSSLHLDWLSIERVQWNAISTLSFLLLQPNELGTRIKRTFALYVESAKNLGHIRKEQSKDAPNSKSGIISKDGARGSASTSTKEYASILAQIVGLGERGLYEAKTFGMNPKKAYQNA